MARTPMVTRTLKSTKVTTLCADLKNSTLTEKEFVLARTYEDEKALLKALAVHNTPELRIVSVKATEIQETLYGMTETDFIKHANPIERPAKAEAEAN